MVVSPFASLHTKLLRCHACVSVEIIGEERKMKHRTTACLCGSHIDPKRCLTTELYYGVLHPNCANTLQRRKDNGLAGPTETAHSASEGLYVWVAG